MERLAVEGITVRFGGVVALDAVDLELGAGMLGGLIGPNGAGKTTLFNVVTGLQAPTSGKVLLDDREITRLAPHRRARLGLARTFQRLELFGTLTARDNVRMAAESQRRRLPAGLSPMRFAEQLLQRVGLVDVAGEPADVLPTGLARLVELARALATSPSVLLLDEPSAGLDQTETSGLGEVLRRVADEGTAVLLVEHDMSLVMGVCDHVTVLDFGKVIAGGEPAAVREDEAVQLAYLGGTATPVDPEQRAGKAAAAYGERAEVMRELLAPSASGRRPRDVSSRHRGPDEAPGRDSEPLALELEQVRAAYGRIEVVHDVSLSVAEGKVLALLGPNGAGKTTLLKVACGQMQPTSGSVRYRGEPIGRTPSDRLARRGLCAMLEGRGVFPNLTVTENLLMYTYRGGVRRDLEERTFERFGVLGARRRQLAGRLSGGEQQMLALARALYTEPSVLLVDELSMGLAPRIVAELYDLLAEAVRSEHLTVVIVEQFAQTALEMADIAAVMVNGRIVRSGDPEQVGTELMSAYMGEAG
ncbi:MAG TPA: ATP-binding cassette domain-containing protein [Acidimicrobiales bacterium]|nr:ATP-binding cassette domain-containing protein [Acidimicrobiales bacterium]